MAGRISTRLSTEHRQQLREALENCPYVREFERRGKGIFWRDAQDGLRHGLQFDIMRSHNIAYDVDVWLLIDHQKARRLIEKGVGTNLSGHLTFVPLSELVQSSMNVINVNYSIYLAVVRELYSGPGLWGGDKDKEYRIAHTFDELDEFVSRICCDLQAEGRKFFPRVDTIPKVLAWLRSDPLAGYAFKQHIIIALHYVRGERQECLQQINKLLAGSPAPVDLRFAEFMKDKCGELSS